MFKTLPCNNRNGLRYSKSALFDAFADGDVVRLTSPSQNRMFIGTITQISLESGPANGEKPHRWMVTLVSDDDVMELYVETF